VKAYYANNEGNAGMNLNLESLIQPYRMFKHNTCKNVAVLHIWLLCRHLC